MLLCTSPKHFFLNLILIFFIADFKLLRNHFTFVPTSVCPSLSALCSFFALPTQLLGSALLLSVHCLLLLLSSFSLVSLLLCSHNGASRHCFLRQINFFYKSFFFFFKKKNLLFKTEVFKSIDRFSYQTL